MQYVLHLKPIDAAGWVWIVLVSLSIVVIEWEKVLRRWWSGKAHQRMPQADGVSAIP